MNHRFLLLNLSANPWMTMTHSFVAHISEELTRLKASGPHKSDALSPPVSLQKFEWKEEATYARIIISALPITPTSAQPQKLRLVARATAWLRHVSSAARRRSISNSEARISSFLGMQDTILYSPVSTPTAVYSKAKRFRYANNNMTSLKEELKKVEAFQADRSRWRLLNGWDHRQPAGAYDLAQEYGAMVMVNDSHAVGFVGKHGRGSAEHCGAEGRVDIITGTLGKALGGASGGYTSAKREVIDWLRQRSLPHLFSNTLMPAIAGASLKVFEIIETRVPVGTMVTHRPPVRSVRAALPHTAPIGCCDGKPSIWMRMHQAARWQVFAKQPLETLPRQPVSLAPTHQSVSPSATNFPAESSQSSQIVWHRMVVQIPL